MTENKTEALKQKLEEEKAEKEAQRLKEEKLQAEMEAEMPKKFILPAWVPWVVGAAVAFVLSFFLKGVIGTIACIVIGVIVIFALRALRQKTIANAHVPGEKEFSSEIATKLYELQDLLIDRAKGVKKAEVRETLGSIAGTLNKIADEVEHDPKDRNKVRKLANYYGDMLLGLVDKYIKIYEKKGRK